MLSWAAHLSRRVVANFFKPTKPQTLQPTSLDWPAQTEFQIAAAPTALDPEEPNPEEPQSGDSLALKSGTRAYARVMDTKRVIQKIRDGKHNGHSYLARRTLTSHEFSMLVEYIGSDNCARSDPKLQKYFNEELRFEYTPSRKEFLIRMPSFMHDGLAEEIGIDIGSWLRSIQNGTICSDKTTINIAEGLGAAGTANMTLPATTKVIGKKGADKAYQHKECSFPGLVIEVAWSQRELDLPQLAEDYIVGSKGEIKTVIGINIHDIYGKNKGKELENKLTNAAATFTIWKANHTTPKDSVEVTFAPFVQDVEWRFSDGEPNESVALDLSLQDFVCDKLARSLDTIENPRLSISSRTLCRHYELAKINHLKEVEREKEKPLQIEAEQAVEAQDQAQEGDQGSPQKKRNSIFQSAKKTIHQLRGQETGPGEIAGAESSTRNTLRRSTRWIGPAGQGRGRGEPQISGSLSNPLIRRRSQRLTEQTR